jgi:NADPH2:quinone reductase
MRAVVVNEPGRPDVLVVEERPDPTPGPGQLLVETAAAGVNYVDTYQRSGRSRVELPAVPGQEGAGRVVTVGSEVEGWQVGDRVAWTGQGGSYAELVVISAERALRVPDNIDDLKAAALPVQGMTAQYLATSTFPVAEGHDVLVHAAAGGVGLLLTQVVTRRGGRVIATVSTPEKAELVRQAGAADVVIYRDEDFTARARELTDGRGVDVVYDGVGASTFDGSLASLAVRGTLVLYGAASGPVPPVDLMRLENQGSLFVTRPSLRHYTADPAELHQRADEVFGWVADGSLSLRIGGTYRLAEAAQAHVDLEGRRTTGKILLLTR